MRVQTGRQEFDMTLPDTLTEALNRNGVRYVLFGRNASAMSVRTIPYAERYRGSTVVLSESPIEHIQQAARDEAKRSKRRR
jgi:hypothetical protein